MAKSRYTVVCLFVKVFPSCISGGVHPVLSEKVTRTTVSSRLYILSYIQEHVTHHSGGRSPTSAIKKRKKKEKRNFSCHVISTAESIPDMGLLTQQTLCFSPDILARTNNMPILTMSVASDWGCNVTLMAAL